MKREEINFIAQILTALKDAVVELEKALKKKDEEKISAIKSEIIGFQKRLDELLSK